MNSTNVETIILIQSNDSIPVILTKRIFKVNDMIEVAPIINSPFFINLGNKKAGTFSFPENVPANFLEPLDFCVVFYN